MTLDELQEVIRSGDLEEFLDNSILHGESPYFESAKVDHVVDKLSRTFGVKVAREQAFVVGSAKIGFALHPKNRRNEKRLDAFRRFSADSDIDIAVVCPDLFSAIWFELSAHSIGSAYSPWDSGKLGDYLLMGWIRPDHFPASQKLRKCNDWWDVFRELSADTILGRRQIRGALFYSLGQLRMYQLYGLQQCRNRMDI